jgi:hypothetical protein
MSRRESIEFTVIPKEALYLEGRNDVLLRVKKEQAYPCQMQKDQPFSCLFSHYAKHNGLDKDNLRFSFVDELSPDQTPLSVHLMQDDDIRVEHITSPLKVPQGADNAAGVSLAPFPPEFARLLEGGEHADIEFVTTVGSMQETFYAHKAILSTRSEYFHVMFKSGGMIESAEGSVHIHHDAATFKHLLRFIYTNTVPGLSKCSADDVIQVLIAADEFL